MARPVSKEFFFLSQVVLGAIFILIAWLLMRPRRPESIFKVREADRPRSPQEGDPLASAKMKRNEPLRLSGISIDGAPHEILGVAPGASAATVQKAYRELMKRYHPDRVGPPGSREWKDAQRIAEALNRAKDALLKKS